MPTHLRPWHRHSQFGLGPRRPLDREQRAVWRARIDLARRAGRITALHALVGLALARRLGTDGQCDPAHATLAADAGASPRTCRRALAALAECGLVTWARRLVRAGWRAAQTSNAYVLVVRSAADFRGFSCDGQTVRQTPKKAFSLEKALQSSSSGTDEWATWNAQRQLSLLKL